MSDIPADLRYSRDHLWVRRVQSDSLIRVGVTDFAQQSLGDVVEVSLPKPGETVEAEPAELDRQLAGLLDADAYRDLAGA